jgi:UDP-glucuronate decarboxylase
MQKLLIDKNKIFTEDFNFIKKNHRAWGLLKNKKILLSGSTGFIASSIIKFLITISKKKKLNLQIDCLLRNKKKGNDIYNQFKLDKKNNLNLIKRNILNDIDLEGQYHYIIHTASLASPSFFTKNPIETILPNSLGVINMLKFAERNKKLKKFIFFSTTGVNGFVDDALRPISEETYGPINHQELENTYLESKRFGETACMSWFHQKKIPINIIRPAITYGPGININDERSYSYFVKSIINNKNIELSSDGSAIRNYCYIADFINGFFFVFFKGKNGETYNVCSKREISIKKLTDTLCNKLFKHKKLKILFTKENFKRINFNRTTVSTKKLENLGWKEGYTINEGFLRTVKSYE